MEYCNKILAFKSITASMYFIIINITNIIISALEIIFNVMRYINLRFTYLLTYLLSYLFITETSHFSFDTARLCSHQIKI